MIHILSNLYGGFFSLHNWATVFDSTGDWVLIFSLIIMECLLSVDNAVVLAAQTQVLPTKKMRKDSLFYGIWGAYLFRFLVIGIGTYMIHFWPIKIIGSAYLLYLVYKFFKPGAKKQRKLKKQKSRAGESQRGLFWRTVGEIELMDIMFSVDSILAGLALSSNPVIVLLGGCIGIAIMRGVAEIIMVLMDKIPELQPMAYVLIAIIAIKLFASIPAINFQVPPLWFGLIVLTCIVVTIIIHIIRQRRAS
ncbi:DUF475 domain-containing protein [Acetilactobacillus jinshanensis]|uniref:DUF475 domain-containing protein n=1 Tax=Acetilactobacillus jinshanensis TaxID=1720083 RepID=A0A4P6ZMR4_9LACO|nr:DUF475 domain-containing protein [Acetilactobacillus jinshanensis]QBP18907.1 DUF475 domain-containing protein [Acetilactobacillus jinshanensis]URL60544.1 DUF475 domain-containing protein [uncultured bacterium]